jgi:hypothetical protein
LLLSWTKLQPSSRARQWRRVGVGIALTSCVTLFAAAAYSDPFNPVPAVLGCAAALGAWLALRVRNTRQVDIGVSSEGQVMLREHDATESSESVSVQMAFASPWLISLRRGTMLVAIWPDSLPQSTFRRLWVHLRWKKAMPSDDRGTSPSNRANSTDR